MVSPCPPVPLKRADTCTPGPAPVAAGMWALATSSRSMAVSPCCPRVAPMLCPCAVPVPRPRATEWLSPWRCHRAVFHNGTRCAAVGTGRDTAAAGGCPRVTRYLCHHVPVSPCALSMRGHVTVLCPFLRVPVSLCPRVRVPTSLCAHVHTSLCPRVLVSHVTESMCPVSLHPHVLVPMSLRACAPRHSVPLCACSCVLMPMCPHVPMSVSLCPRIHVPKPPCPHVPMSPCPPIHVPHTSAPPCPVLVSPHP